MDRLARLHREIRACTKCVAAGYLATAMPILAGTSRDRVAIVGQAPGAIEITTGLPFTGRSGRILREWLAEAGIDEAHLPYRTAVTKCFPGKAKTGPGDRRPSPAEIELCAPWLEQELALLKPRVILLIGTLAIERLWGRVALASVIGTLRREPDRVLIPLPHPSGASRWLNEPANKALLRKALRLVRREVVGLDSAGIAGRMHRSR
ncbi:MAG: uracil-DNA glycosylase family protein [Chloroflexi bacterium]|nr:uracil-DNA glycosylase family protein [Chloroflexota bacterium]